MMNLMEDKPESVLMSQNVPPIEEEGSHKPTHETFRYGHFPGGQIEGGEMKGRDPKPRCCKSVRKLRKVHQQRPPVPPLSPRQITPRKFPLQNHEDNSREHDQHAWKSDGQSMHNLQISGPE